MRNYNIIDTFIFGGELDLLKMRLDYLYDSVDYFVISESNRFHSGEKKDLQFLLHFNMFERYRDKIHYVVFEPDITGMQFIPSKEDTFSTDFFKLERTQRNAIQNKVIEIANENSMILHGDLDEFPDKTKFDKMREITKDLFLQVVSLSQPTYYYAPTNLLEIEWYGTVVFNYQTLINLSDYFSVRENRFNCQHLQNAGYHLSFFMSLHDMQKKLQSFSHQEYNLPEITDLDQIKRKVYQGLDIIDRPEVKIKKLPFISAEFPMEFYRHDLFFNNTFERGYLKPQQVSRMKQAMQIPLEIENLQLTVANHNPKVILEIGTANGGTLARWFELKYTETIISLDHAHGIHGGSGFESRTYVISDAIEQANLTKKEFYAVNGDSKDPYLINRVSELLNGRKIDFLFIDGDHTYEGVKNDFLIYQQFLSDDAIVGFHDIINSQFHLEAGCQVYNFWQEIKKEYEYLEFIHTEHLDAETTPSFSNSKHIGGFGGIGVIYYGKKKVFNQLISLVVPVYNNAESSIRNIRTTLESSKYIDEVILYSNGTDGEEIIMLRDFAKKEQKVKLIEVDKPIGYIKAVNNSMKIARNELILCLNSDACLYQDWEDRLIPYCLDSRYGIVGPIMARDFILGCCFIIKKSVMNKIGMLDEGFGLGYEDDVEYSERVEQNGWEIGYCEHKHDFGWSAHVSFPINHRQGETFQKLDNSITDKLIRLNYDKRIRWSESDHVVVLKNLDYDEVIKNINHDYPILVVNHSGQNFERIRYDEKIVEVAKIIECTDGMNIQNLINANTKNKKVTVINGQKKKLTWLAKYNDSSSMGILSQRILENLKDFDLSCKEIIGKTTTDNKLIHQLLNKEPNYDLGIMFSYPDIHTELNPYDTKVIYSGVDTTGGIANFAENINNADFILTPSNLSKDRMLKLGVDKPIFILPHGVDPDLFTFKERKLTDKFKFLYVGECSDRKGIFQLLEAFTSLFRYIPSVELYIKSNTEMLFYNMDEFNLIKEKYSNIHWIKSDEGHESVIKLYEECHVYVYPSRADTFGMTLLEAMACGLPIISTSEPGATEIIEGRYYKIDSTLVPVKNHPWMLGEWGEPDVNSIKSHMMNLYSFYYNYADEQKLKENSDFIRHSYSWDAVAKMFSNTIFPQLNKKYRILTLLTSYNRPHHILNVIQSLKDIRENKVTNDIYLVENSDVDIKGDIVKLIRENIDSYFTLYVSEFNLGQRGALLQMLEDVNIDNYDFIQFTDQDNQFVEPLKTYCEILNENKDMSFATGYMSKEHAESGWRQTKHGRLCEKRAIRAGHMVMRASDLKKLLPIHLDSQFGESYNASWNAGLDWEITHWNKSAPGRFTSGSIALCLPGGVLHKGTDSTMYDWDVASNEYTEEELRMLRY